MSEAEIEKLANISMKNFRKNNHFNLKDILENQPTILGYEKALYITSDYGELFFIYNAKSEW